MRSKEGWGTAQGAVVAWDATERDINGGGSATRLLALQLYLERHIATVITGCLGGERLVARLEVNNGGGIGSTYGRNIVGDPGGDVDRRIRTGGSM